MPVQHDDLHAFPEALIGDIVRSKFRQIVGKAGIAPQDRDDIEQELMLVLLRRWPRFNPGRGQPGAFLKKVADRIVANLLRDQQAQKRDRRGQQSLNMLVRSEDGDLAEWTETISQVDQDRRQGKATRSEEEVMQLRLDLEGVLASMPSLRRELAELLKHMSPSAAARKLGRSVDKTKLSVALILRRFEEASLRDYL